MGPSKKLTAHQAWEQLLGAKETAPMLLNLCSPASPFAKSMLSRMAQNPGLAAAQEKTIGNR